MQCYLRDELQNVDGVEMKNQQTHTYSATEVTDNKIVKNYLSYIVCQENQVKLTRP